MKNRLHLRVRMLGVVAVAGACAVAVALPGAASASAYGCTTSGAGLPWYGLNSAYTCIQVIGNGDNVTTVQGSWNAVVGTICNYRWEVRFTDINNRGYETDWSPVHLGCTTGQLGPTETFSYSGRSANKRAGQVCVYLFESGSQRNGAPCESIHP